LISRRIHRSLPHNNRNQSRTMAMATVSALKNPVTVHSTFRSASGHKVLPYGLQWHMSGDSHASYVPWNGEEAIDWVNDQTAHSWIVQAHNKWCFAKDRPFRKVEDIAKVSWVPFGGDGPQHLQVEWKPLQHEKEEVYKQAKIENLLEQDKSATGEEAPAEVWLNGHLEGMLQPETLPEILAALEKIQSRRLTYTKTRGIIRIERRFVGMIKGQDVFEHLMDNLYAMEDPQEIDELTLIGTATLPDWIMGGELTSRIWIREQENGNILCMRPLYDDRLDSSDRKYELKRGKDDSRIATVKEELERLRYLASLPSPFDEDKVVEEEKKELTEREKLHRSNRRRMYGM
jgi:hypothetical protein